MAFLFALITVSFFAVCNVFLELSFSQYSKEALLIYFYVVGLIFAGIVYSSENTGSDSSTWPKGKSMIAVTFVSMLF